MTGWCTIGPGQPPNHSRRLPSLCRWYCGGLLFAAHAGAVLAVTSPMTIDATTVVVVDDDPCLRELMGRCLEQRGCLVIVAQDGREALRIIERYPDPIDLLISDVIMPHVGGFALVAQVSQERPAMKILYVSAHAESSPEVRMGLQAAGRLYLKKPFQHDEFLKVIDQALNLTAGGAADAVSLVVSHPALRAQAVPTWRPAGGQPRSGLRYRVNTPVQFRLSDTVMWEDGVLRDLSRSGLHFDTTLTLEDRDLLRAHPPVDVRVRLPRRRGRDINVACRGELVRTTHPEAPARHQGLAIEVASYGVDMRPSLA